jgi:hypothetical protein
MSLFTNLEGAVEKVLHDVEAEVAKIDGAALTEARTLLAEAKAAEDKVLSVLGTSKADILALVAKYGPEAVAALEAELSKLLASIRGVFGVAGE